jgi:hypothetical protein
MSALRTLAAFPGVAGGRSPASRRRRRRRLVAQPRDGRSPLAGNFDADDPDHLGPAPSAARTAGNLPSRWRRRSRHPRTNTRRSSWRYDLRRREVAESRTREHRNVRRLREGRSAGRSRARRVPVQWPRAGSENVVTHRSCGKDPNTGASGTPSRWRAFCMQAYRGLGDGRPRGRGRGAQENSPGAEQRWAFRPRLRGLRTVDGRNPASEVVTRWVSREACEPRAATRSRVSRCRAWRVGRSGWSHAAEVPGLVRRSLRLATVRSRPPPAPMRTLGALTGKTTRDPATGGGRRSPPSGQSSRRTRVRRENIFSCAGVTRGRGDLYTYILVGLLSANHGRTVRNRLTASGANIDAFG